MLNLVKFLFLTLPIFSFGCTGSNVETDRQLSNEFKDYWFDGTAEINSFKLLQSRYGETREGHAVLIFVSEPFSPEKQVKLDNPDDKQGINVMKLNFVRKFTTGIYPYSVMLSTFSPLTYYGESTLLKETFSSQEWCGQVFTQLNKYQEGFAVNSYSYFEEEGDKSIVVREVFTEDEIWTRIRFSPEELPEGQITVLPGLTTLRLRHLPLEPVSAEATLSRSENRNIFRLVYETGWELEVTFETQFPYRIQAWKELYNGQLTEATLMKTKKLPYWQLNKSGDVVWRDSLDLQ